MNPPCLATALLKRVSANDALAGDLREAYASGKSDCWYWRQVLSVIGEASLQTARRHPARTIGAALLGAACVWISTQYVPVILGFDQWLFETGVNRWFYLNGYHLPQWGRDFPALALWKAWAFGVASYAIARIDLRSAIPFALAVAIGNLVVFVQFSLGANSYSMMQLVGDLIVLYPMAALVGAFIGSRPAQLPC